MAKTMQLFCVSIRYELTGALFILISMEIQAVGEWIATINGTEEGMMPTLYKAEADIGGTPASAIVRYAEKPHARLLMPGCPFR